MPPFRTALLLLPALLVGAGGGGGVVWDGGVGLGRVPVWLALPGAGQIERGVEVWGDAPGWSPLSDGLMPASISERGGTAPPGKRKQQLTTRPTYSILYDNTITDNFAMLIAASTFFQHNAVRFQEYLAPNWISRDAHDFLFYNFCVIMTLLYFLYILLEFICVQFMMCSKKSPDLMSKSVKDNSATTPLPVTKDVRFVSPKVRKTNKCLTYVSDEDWDELCKAISKISYQYVGESNVD